MNREELLQKVKTSRPAATVFGLGGAGCNIATWIADKKAQISCSLCDYTIHH